MPKLSLLTILAAALNLTLTEFDIYTHSLYDFFSGQNLTFALSPSIPLNESQARIVDPRSTATSAAAIPALLRTAPQAQTAVSCFKTYCLTQSQSTLRLYDAGGLIWGQRTNGPVAASVILDWNEDVLVFALADQTIYGWDVNSSTPLVYSGAELREVSNVTLRETHSGNFLSLILRGEVAEQKLALVYVLQSGALTYFRSVSLRADVVDIRTVDSLLYAFYSRSGISAVELALNTSISQARGTVAGEILAVSNIRHGQVALLSADAVLVAALSPLRVVSYVPTVRLAGQNVELWLESEELTVVSDSQAYIFDVGRRDIVFAPSLNRTMATVGHWYANETHYFLQEDGSFTYVTKCVSRSPDLRLAGIQHSFSLRVSAFSRMTLSESDFTVVVWALSATDSSILAGSGYEIQPLSSPIAYEGSFEGGVATVFLSLHDLFSGPFLTFSTANVTVSPASVEWTHYIAQAVFDFAFVELPGVDSRPEIGCMVSAAPSLFMLFTGNYVVVSDAAEEIYMRSLELLSKPKLCVTEKTTAWVYTEDGVLYTLEVLVRDGSLSMRVKGEETTPVLCQKIRTLALWRRIKSNNAYFTCESSAALYVKRISDNQTAIFSAELLASPHRPFSIVSSCFLGDSAVLALADSNNGVNLLDLSDLFAGAAVRFFQQWFPQCALNTSLHFSDDTLVIVSSEIVVYSISGFSLSLRMCLPTSSAPHSGMLLHGLFYMSQGELLYVFDVNAPVHAAQYASLPVKSHSQFLTFPLGDLQYVLQLWQTEALDYNLTLYQVSLPKSGAYLYGSVVGNPALNGSDVEVNFTLVVQNSQASLQAEVRVRLLNRGTFPSILSSLQPYYTLISDQQAEMPLFGLFKGSSLSFQLDINGVSDFSYISPPVLMRNLTEQSVSVSPQCFSLQSVASLVFCLSNSKILVYSISSALVFNSAVVLTDESHLYNDCTSLVAAEWSTDVLLLVASCEMDQNATRESYEIQPGLISILLDRAKLTEISRAITAASVTCTDMHVVKLNETTATLFCVTGHSLLRKSDVSTVVLNQFSVYWSGSLSEGVSISAPLLLAPYNTGLQPFQPLSFAVIPANASYQLLVYEPEHGAVLLRPSGSDTYSEEFRIPSKELDAVTKAEAVSVSYCAGKVVVALDGHMAVYSGAGGNWTHERTIFPYNHYWKSDYTGEFYCDARNDSLYLLAGVADSGKEFFRLIRPGTGNESSILQDFPGLGVAVVCSKELVVMDDWMTGQLVEMRLRTPAILAPACSESEFRNLTKVWGTNIFNVSVVASNSLASIATPNVTFRRMLHHILSAEKPLFPTRTGPARRCRHWFLRCTQYSSH